MYRVKREEKVNKNGKMETIPSKAKMHKDFEGQRYGSSGGRTKNSQKLRALW